MITLPTLVQELGVPRLTNSLYVLDAAYALTLRSGITGAIDRLTAISSAIREKITQRSSELPEPEPTLEPTPEPSGDGGGGMDE